MPHIKDATGSDLDSEYTIDVVQGVSGLILESWGPPTRNPQYNDAMDVLLTRLKELQLSYVSINVISRNLISAFPEFNERSILINGTSELKLAGRSAKELRIEIGREQARLKVDSSATGGNRTKRVLLHNPILSDSTWIALASGKLDPKSFINSLIGVTENRRELDVRVDALSKLDILQPAGNKQPKKRTTQTEAYARDPVVKAWILREANGSCELCEDRAPFLKENGIPYLEVHHILPLAEGGSDTTSNTVALCPNCHMEMHFSFEKHSLRTDIVKKIERLSHEVIS